MIKYLIAGVFMLVATDIVTSQGLRYMSPEKLNNNVNSEFEESKPLLSSDGKTLYFVRTGTPDNEGGEYAGQDVWYSRFENGVWSSASNDLEAINNGDNNAVVGISDNDNKLFLINAYSAHPRRNRGVVFTAKNGDTWIPPRELGVKVKMKSDFYGFHISPDEKILMISMKGDDTFGEEDLYVSFKNDDDTWTEPLHLGEVINSEGYEISPFLCADEKTLYFSSNGHGGLGSADIYKSERLDDSWTNWSVPENLGEGINSQMFDAYMSVYEDKAFFASNRDGETADLYVTGMIKPEEEKVTAHVVEEAHDEKEKVLEEETPETPIKEEIPEEEPLREAFVVYFAFDDFDLSSESKSRLNEVLNMIDQNQVSQVKVTGHADSQGPKEYNQLLSEKRAKAVAKFLRDKGVNIAQINTQGAGEEQPVAPNNILKERKQNRRVEIVVE